MKRILEALRVLGWILAVPVIGAFFMLGWLLADQEARQKMKAFADRIEERRRRRKRKRRA